MPRLRVLVNKYDKLLLIYSDQAIILLCDFSFSKPGLELDSQFRLFLSSKPDVNFPLELLQLGLKVCFISFIFSQIILSSNV